MEDKIKVLVVEDDDLIARHYQTSLSKDVQLILVGRAANGYEAVMLQGCCICRIQANTAAASYGLPVIHR